MKCKKIKLKIPYPAKKIFKQWNDYYRYCYNRNLWIYKETGATGNALRNTGKNNSQYIFNSNILNLPTELREGASFEVSKNIKSAFSNLWNSNINHFEIKYKTKKSKSWTLTNFQKRSLKIINEEKRRSFTILNSYCPYVLHTFEKLPEITNDFSLHFDGSDYYLILPYEERIEINKTKTQVITALDPGIRTFQTSFNNYGESFEICKSDSSAKLHSLALVLDGLISKRSKISGRKKKERNKVSIQILKIRKKMKNLQLELHNKTVNFLTKTSDIIIIPTFKVKGMSKKVKRKLQTKTVRKLMLLGHSSFKEKLKTKALERGCHLLISEEHYTSKTCTYCGKINNKLGGSKIFTCKEESCLQIIDRDVNGARNILLRALRGSAISFKEILETTLFSRVILKRWKHCINETINSLGTLSLVNSI